VVGSSFRSEAACVGVKEGHSAPLMVAMKSSRRGCMKRTHSATPRSCHCCGRRGCHGASCEKATEHLASLSAGQVGWCPESASRSGGVGRNPHKGASLRRLQVHDGTQNGHSHVPPNHHWSAWMSVHRGSLLRLFHRQFDRAW
jgi:hypothetical protein